MDKNEKQFRLSPEAFRGLKEIVKDEICEQMEDSEIENMGIRLLRLFSILGVDQAKKEVQGIEVSEQELKVLTFLREEICGQKRSPSVREISRAAGFRSSRSGFRLLNRLIKRGLIFRSQKGQLGLSSSVCSRKKADQ